MARGVISEKFAGHCGYADPSLNRGCVPAFQAADVVLVLGKRIDYRLAMGGPRLFGKETRFIQVDVEPEEIGRAAQPADVRVAPHDTSGRARYVGEDAVGLIASGRIDLVVNTPRGRGPQADGMHIRRAALAHGVACVTTVAAALAAAAGIADEAGHEPEVRSLQEYHADAQLRFGV